MIPSITEVNFPSYATLHQATITLQDMGERTISTQVKIDGDIVPDFSGWELRFKGERFVLPINEPQATKDNSTRNSLVDLNFQSWAIQEMKRYYFFTLPSATAGVAIPDQYEASVNMSVSDFVNLFNGVLEYYFGQSIKMRLYSGTYDTTPVGVEISYSYIWDVLTKFYDTFGLRWRIEYDSTSSSYIIKVNYPSDAINDHDFEYGYQGGLLKFERQVQDESINNILLGRGGEKNIPYRYFKRTDPQNPGWAADPDALYELKDIYFDRLRDANFRWYVRGWMQNSHRDTTWETASEPYTYPQYTENDCPSEYKYAFHRGLTDEKFNPVEYVADTLACNPSTGAITASGSIEKYGERWGAVENNDEIYPTIQGVSRSPIGRVDETVAVSEIITDDIDAAAQNSVQENLLEGRKSVWTPLYPASSLLPSEHTEVFVGEPFTIPTGKTANLYYTTGDDNLKYFLKFDREETAAVKANVYIDTTVSTLQVKDESTGNIIPASGLTAGTYRYVATVKVVNTNEVQTVDVTYGFNGIRMVIADEDENAWKPTFDIWVKNIWNTTKGANESAEDYALRVWKPILGDRLGNEAKLVFSTGPMSISQDYEFQIATYPTFDQSKTINDIPSEWKITLRKSEAEYEVTGLFIPNATTGGKPIAGDKFFFVGIDMPNQYVQWNEENLAEYKTDKLDETAAANPTWAITLDKIRVNTLEDGEYGQTLAERLSAGCKINTTDPRFTPGEVLTLYVQSLTYTWNDGDQTPEIEVILSDKIVSTQSVVSKLQGDISSIRSSYVRAEDLDSAIRKVASPLFLKKTGESDSSNSPTAFANVVRSKNFRQGDIGGAGWGFYEDADGASVFEADKLVVRQEMRVNNLIANQISYVGGKRITSAAAIECTQVIEDANYYTCYFDQRQGSVKNLFVVNDIAMGQTFDEENVEVRYYRMVVAEAGADYIKLTKSGQGGTGAPAKGDTIVQYGNTTTTARQFVIVEDVIGGGYQRMLDGLNSTTSAGNEYYFAGKQNNKERWFVGSAGEYAKWEDGALQIKGTIIAKNGNTYVDMATALGELAYLTTALPESSTIISGGLVLSKVIALTDADNNVMSGMNGVPTLSNIAAWYGGPMEDAENPGSGSGSGSGYAKSLFRFDGSGYLAGGNIFWAANGSGGIPGITWDASSSSIVIGGNVKLASMSGDSVTELLNAVRTLLSMFEKRNIGTEQNPVYAVHVLNDMGFYSDSFISAGGAGSGSGGGGGGGIDLDRVWQSLTNSVVDSHATDLIALAHIPSLPWSQITSGKPTTISGYGISDAYTKSEVNSLISAIDQFHYEIYADLSDVTSPQSNVLYLIGPTGSGTDKYDEYVYPNATTGWTKIGETSIDLSGYVNSVVASGSGNYISGFSKSGNTLTLTMGTLPTTIALSNVTGADDLKAIEALTGTSGLLKKTAANTWALDTNTYLTGNQTITLSGDVSGSGATSIAVSIGAGKVTNAMLAGSIENGKLSNSSIKIGSTTVNLGDTITNLAGLGSISAAGALTLTTTKKIYFGSTSYYLELDSNGYLHTNVGFYSDSFVSAGGVGSGGSGGGIDLDRMWQSLTNSVVDSHANDLIAVAHIPNIENITNFSTKVYDASVSRTANYVLAAPNGSAGAATFRALVSADIPSLTISKISDAESWISGKGYVTSSGVTSVATGTGLTGGTITSTGTISISSTYQTYISNGNTAYGWGNHASAGYLTSDNGTTISSCLQSLQAQIDSVAANRAFDEIVSTAVFADMLSASAANIASITGSLTGNATTASYLYSSSYAKGGEKNPVYFSGGLPVASTSTEGSASLPVYLNGGTLTAITASSMFPQMSSSTTTNLSVSVAGQNRTIPELYAKYDTSGETITDKFTIVSNALQSLQGQIDSVAEKYAFDTLTATNGFFDMLSVGAGIGGHLRVMGDIRTDGNIYLNAGKELDLDGGLDVIYYDSSNHTVFFNFDYNSHFGSGIYSDSFITAGATASSSDARLKDDIKTISPSRAISILSQLKGREWVWNERRKAFAGKRGSGLVAQEVQEVMPWAVLDLNGEYSITYGSFWGIAIPVMQSHESRIQSLENEVSMLRAENEELKRRLTIKQ